ncbi:MAG: prepilin-type N-terminal cleavage/methylation domain-containing protein [Planctomycetota bacterium]
MSARTYAKKGFTLVEILIVVVILGILAAIVIPQFTQASESARASSLKSQLQTIRSQLELYQVQHLGDYPTLANLQANDDAWGNMTTLTNEDGTTTGTPELGPYLQKAPSNPFANSADSTAVIALAADGSVSGAGATTAWAYNETNGEIKAIVPNAKALDLNLVETGFSAGDDDPDFWTY